MLNSEILLFSAFQRRLKLNNPEIFKTSKLLIKKKSAINLLDKQIVLKSLIETGVEPQVIRERRGLFAPTDAARRSQAAAKLGRKPRTAIRVHHAQTSAEASGRLFVEMSQFFVQRRARVGQSREGHVAVIVVVVAAATSCG